MTPQVGNDSARRPSLFRWAVAFACWVAFIWGHSLVQGPQSSLESGFVVALARPLFEALGVSDPELMSLVVRKLAHFSEYAVLGVLARGLFAARLAERGRPPLPGRVPRRARSRCGRVPAALRARALPGQPTDVLIDLLSGLLAGALLAWLVARLRRR